MRVGPGAHQDGVAVLAGDELLDGLGGALQLRDVCHGVGRRGVGEDCEGTANALVWGESRDVSLRR